MGFFKKRAEGYEAAFRVEKYRAAAVEMRESDPTVYAQVLAQADGSEAEGAARRDPDAYVALFLAAYDDEEVGAPSPAQEGRRDVDYWPTLDLDAVWAQVTETFHGAIDDRGATQLYFPGWLVRRIAAHALMGQVLLIRPDLGDEVNTIFYGADDDAEPMREDAALDEELDAFLARNHLSQIVGALVQGLSAEE